MRRFLYVLLLALLPFAPVERLDVAKLEPVQTVALSYEGGQAVLQTDTGRKGVGADAAAALQDLKENTPGAIYFDTAEYLLATETALEQVAQIKDHFRRSLQLTLWDGQGSVEEGALWLNVHAERSKISHWRTLFRCEK